MDLGARGPRHVLLGIGVGLGLWMGLSAPSAHGADEAYVGIRWESDLAAGLTRARREGRPMLFAINALDSESANRKLAYQLYRSKAWGDATQGYVCFVCSPGDHTGPDGLSTRFHGIPSAANQAAFKHVVKHYVKSQISPQHVIVEPDGTLAYRKPYFEYVVGPSLLQDWLARISPDVALTQVVLHREEQVRQLEEATEPKTLDTLATAWLAKGDPLAPSGLVAAYEAQVFEHPELARRLVEHLAKTPRKQIRVVEYAALEAVLAPDEDPALSLHWLKTLYAVDVDTGLRAAARALARSTDAKLRKTIQGLWRLSESGQPMATHAALLAEALALAGDRGAQRLLPESLTPLQKSRWLRAQVKGGLISERPGHLLTTALARPDNAGALRSALLAASRDALKGHEAAIDALLATHDMARVRHAAALACLRVGRTDAKGQALPTLLAGLRDPVEGPELLHHAARILGEDAGSDMAGWKRLLGARLNGGAK